MHRQEAQKKQQVHTGESVGLQIDAATVLLGGKARVALRGVAAGLGLAVVAGMVSLWSTEEIGEPLTN